MDTTGTELTEGVRTPPPAMLASGALMICNPMGGRLRFLQVISFPVPGIQGGSPPQPPPPAEETLVFTRFAPLKSLLSLLCGPCRVHLSPLEPPRVRLSWLRHPESVCLLCALLSLFPSESVCLCFSEALFLLHLSIFFSLSHSSRSPLPQPLFHELAASLISPQL